MFRVIRVTARALGALALLVLLISFLGHGPARLSGMTTREILGSLATMLGFAGLIAAWWQEGIGGGLAVAAFVLHAVATRSVLSQWTLWIAAAAGLLFVALWWARRKGMDTEAFVPPGPLSRRVAARIAVGAGAVIVAWLAVEIVLPKPFLTTRAATVQAVAERWEGRTRVVNDWGPPGDLAVVLSANGNGTVEGTIGAASFRNAALVPNRSWLGSVFHIRSDYRLTGALSGVITPRFVIECATFTMRLSFGTGTLDGRLSASDCSRAGKKQGTLRATLIKFKKPVQRKR